MEIKPALIPFKTFSLLFYCSFISEITASILISTNQPFVEQTPLKKTRRNPKSLMSRKIKLIIMSNTIDILTVVDTVSLREAVSSGSLKKGTKAAPRSLGSYANSDAYIYMITAKDYVVNNQAKSELTVTANIGDTVRWMITCPGGGTGSNVIMMGWKAGSGGDIVNPISLDLDINLYVGSPTVAPTTVEFQNYCYAGMVTKQGVVQYVITFQLLDEHGNDLGYYQWDPFINVSN